MKKFSVLIGTLALIILALVPKLMGLLINSSDTNARLREITGQPSLTMTTHSGWFSSVGTLQIDAPIIAGTRYEQVRIDSDLEIMHGPILWTEQGLRIGLAWINAVPVLNGLDENALLQTLFKPDGDSQVSLMAGFDGSLHAQLRSGAIRYKQGEQAFDFEDLLLVADIARDGAATIGLTTNSVNVRDTSFAMTIDALDIELHSASLDASPLPGSLAINAVSAQLNSFERLTLGGISLDYVAASRLVWTTPRRACFWSRKCRSPR